MTSLENALQLVAQTYQNINIIITASILFAFLLTEKIVIVNVLCLFTVLVFFWSMLCWRWNTFTTLNFLCTYPASSDWKRYFGHSIVLVCWRYQHQNNTGYTTIMKTLTLYISLANYRIHSATSEMWNRFTVLPVKRSKHFLTSKSHCEKQCLGKLATYYKHVPNTANTNTCASTYRKVMAEGMNWLAIAISMPKPTHIRKERTQREYNFCSSEFRIQREISHHLMKTMLPHGTEMGERQRKTEIQENV